MVIRVQNNKTEMKKSYKSPEVSVVELDADELCQTIVYSPTLDTENVVDNEDAFAAPTYRTNLWN